MSQMQKYDFERKFQLLIVEEFVKDFYIWGKIN